MKPLILAANYHQFVHFCREWGINPYKEAVLIKDWRQAWGYSWKNPVIILEGYENNREYDLGLMEFIGNRFDNIGYLSEGEMWNESIEF